MTRSFHIPTIPHRRKKEADDPGASPGRSVFGLRAKFNLAIIFAFAIGFGATAVHLAHRFDETARASTIQNARLMLASANAIRQYTSKVVQPLVGFDRDGKFINASVPAFAARSHFSSIQADFPEYSYKEAVINPTNLADRTSDWEADIVGMYQRTKSADELVIERDTPLGPSLALIRPLTIKDPACLVCHSTPEAAPISMRKVYGEANGFGWQLNDVIGAQIVSIPLAPRLEVARQTLAATLFVLLGVFAAMMVIMNVLLHFLVIRPVSKISAIATDVSMGNIEAEQFTIDGNDEIAMLSRAFNRMRRSLQQAMAMLEGLEDEEPEGGGRGGGDPDTDGLPPTPAS